MNGVAVFAGPIDRYLLTKKREDVSFPGAGVLKKTRSVRDNFTQIQIGDLERLWKAKHHEFVASSFFPSKLDQTSSWSALSHAGICRERLLPSGPRFESEDRQKWGVLHSASRNSTCRRSVVLRCLRCRPVDFEDSRVDSAPSGSKFLNQNGTPSQTCYRRNGDHNCLAFVEVYLSRPNSEGEWDPDTLVIDEIRGFVGHSAGCLEDVDDLRPSTQRLEPSLLKTVVKGVQHGGTRYGFEEKVISQASTLPVPPTNIRHKVNKRDVRTIRERLLKLRLGIDLHSGASAEQTVHDLIGPTSTDALKENVFLYQPETRKSRLMIGLLTSDMRQAAREHCHNGLLFIDGTFGLCKHNVLVFFLMTTDEEGKGVPIGVFILSAANNSKSIPASYAADLLATFLHSWAKEAALDPLTKSNLLGSANAVITPVVAMTDADVTEKSALRSVWHSIFTITCIFHVYQAWRRKSPLALGTGGSSPEKAHRRNLSQEIRDLGRKLAEVPMSREAQLKCMTDFSSDLKSRARRYPSNHWRFSLLWAGVDYIEEYFISFWLLPGRSLEWTAAGRVLASKILRRARPSRSDKGNAVPTTKNIIEALNSWFKYVGLTPFKNGGKLLRLDVLLCAMLKSIFPFLFNRKRAEDELSRSRKLHFDEWAAANPSAAAKIANRIAAFSPSPEKSATAGLHFDGSPRLVTLSFQSTDRTRDDRAEQIVLDSLICEAPEPEKSADDFENYLLQSLGGSGASDSGAAYLAEQHVASEFLYYDVSSSTDALNFYRVSLNRFNCYRSSCTCADFRTSSRDQDWCKHLRAAAKYSPCVLKIPKSKSAAMALRESENNDSPTSATSPCFHSVHPSASDLSSKRIMSAFEAVLENMARSDNEDVSDDDDYEAALAVYAKDFEPAHPNYLDPAQTLPAVDRSDDTYSNELSVNVSYPPQGIKFHLSSLENTLKTAQDFAIRVHSGLSAVLNSGTGLTSALSKFTELHSLTNDEIMPSTDAARLDHAVNACSLLKTTHQKLQLSGLIRDDNGDSPFTSVHAELATTLSAVGTAGAGYVGTKSRRAPPSDLLPLQKSKHARRLQGGGPYG